MLPDPKDPAFLGTLVYFHHAATHLSFSRAAEAMNVSPSAVSHRIAALEAALGKRLFERRVREVRLTQDGTELMAATGRIWGELQSLTEQQRQQEVLRVSVGPYLSSQWLLPRIGAFEALHPGLRVDLVHVIGEPAARLADVSIIWSDLDRTAGAGTLLFGPKAIPVAAPEHQLGPSFWAGSLPPIHYRDRRTWRHWLCVAGAPADFAERGEVLDEPHLVLETAAYGRGVAIGFLPFIRRFFEQGRLVPVSPRAVRSDRGYRLVCNAPEHAMARAFADWLTDQAGGATMPEPMPASGTAPRSSQPT